MFKKRFDDSSVVKSIFLAYFILLLHVGLLAAMGILVLFFGGIVKYMVWILLGGGVLLAGSGYMLIRYFKKESMSLSKILMMPEFRGKNVEVNVLGGLASVKITSSGENAPVLGHDGHPTLRRIESPETRRVRELTELARLLEKDLITPDEYYRAKQELFGV